MPPRLKSLELHGYKTFASRSNFEFPGDITAVVGPNGSGKSNIADAIRWVLGEQSYSLLRGRKTEDMIFAGSEARPRAGMASAAITFDNQDGWLPIDYSEVSIMRRAYRDGSNEYLLNGQRVRLKEISELLAQSGLAERTYTIIGQGLVDAALSLKPEERRRFFEEAAGIGLYRGRREDALNRLDATRRNLERVLDILTELEPRLASLEKQARRVQEYERIKTELRLLLRDWYGYHWNANQKELRHTLDVLRVQEARQGQARDRLAEIERAMAALRTELQRNRDRLNQWHGQSAGLHTQREQVSRKLAVMDERRRALQEQTVALAGDLSRLEEEQKTRQERLDTAQAEYDSLERDLADSEEQAREALGSLNSRQRERAGAETRLREARQALVAAETRQVRLNARQSELKNRREEQAGSQQTLNQAVQRGEALAEAARKRLQEAEAARQRAEQEQNQAEASFQAAQKELAEAESQRRHLLDTRSRLEAERTRLKAQLDVIEQAERSFSGLNSGAKLLLQAVRQGRLSGGYHLIGGQLIVPGEYEAAIAACLGETLDAIALDARADPEQALEMLTASNQGRALLFPSDWVRVAEPLAVPDDPDCLGLAADLVQAPPELEPTVRLLLGQILVARTRAGARRLAAGLPTGGRAVTLKGEVFYAHGAVEAGQGARPAAISRPRQKRELTTALDRLEEDLRRQQHEAGRVDELIRERQAGARDLEKTARATRQAYQQAGQAYQQAALDGEQTRQKHEWQCSQLAGLDGQIKKTDAEISQVAGDLGRIEKEIAAFHERVREAGRALGALPLDELQAQVVHWNTQTAVIQRAVKDARARLSDHRQALDTNLAAQASYRRRQEEQARALDTLDKERQTALVSEQELNQQIETLRLEIEPAENALQGIERDYAALQGDQVAAQQALAVADRHVTQTQLELARLREAIASLKRRIEEDFGLVAFDYSGDHSGQTPLPLEGMVEELPVLDELPSGLEDSINRQRAQLRRLGAVNFEAQTEYEAVKERYLFLKSQVEDLRKADVDLRQVIAELDELMKREFKKTFSAVAGEFKIMFTRMFGGGSARLVMTDEDHPTETGIDIEARLPGRREQGLTLLSGGERSLTAVALIFSLLKVSPTPFCIMDEVDAMLDEANVGRFRDLLKELSQNTQFIVITHNRNTVQVSDVIYGITMGRDSASQVISLRLDQISDEMVK